MECLFVACARFLFLGGRPGASQYVLMLIVCCCCFV
ncbi:protein of unknown function [Methylocella tundrae]|uniref:Uncharacterized protein n=1 Tax=Methylocella tundrae TaxID=227605 RepID=A0A4U8YZL4_METTU|nr:protein of unknown function [Methylocella tundrae]